MKTSFKNFRNRDNIQLVLVFILLSGAVILTSPLFTNRHHKISGSLIIHEKTVPQPLQPVTQIPDILITDSVEKKFLNKTIAPRKVVTAHKTEARWNVAAPIPSLIKKPVTRQVETASGSLMKYPSGTQVVIPPRAFVDKTGKEVEGNVDITYKEYNSIYDIFISGIPMTYDSGGSVYEFESAGMMELTASLNSEPVYLSPGKKINIQLATDNREEDFNLYYFDPQKGNWIYKERSRAGEMIDSRRTVSTTVINTPSQLFTYEPLERGYISFSCTDYTPAERVKGLRKVKRIGNFVFRFDETFFNRYPEFRPFRSASWQCYDKDAKRMYSELFRKRYSKNSNRSPGRFWNGIVLKHEPGENEFVFYFSNDGDTLVIPAYAMLARKRVTVEKSSARVLKKLEEKYAKCKAIADFTYYAENVRYERFRKDSASYVAMGGVLTDRSIPAILVRSFEADGFGIYNCDRVIQRNDAVTMAVTFTDLDNNLLPLQNVYLVDKRIKSVISSYAEAFREFRFNPGAENIIWAILPDNRFAYVTPEDFLTIKKGDTQHAFKMKVLPNAEEGMKEVRKIFRI